MNEFPCDRNTDDPDSKDLAEWMEEFAKEDAIVDGLSQESADADDWWEEPTGMDIDDEEGRLSPSVFTQTAASSDQQDDAIDDSLRMYLREIGRVPLLAPAAERRLALRRASYKHIEKGENELRGDSKRPVKESDVVRLLLKRLYARRELLNAVIEYLAIEEEMTLAELLYNEKLRANIDRESNVEMLESLAERYGKEPVEMGVEVVQLVRFGISRTSSGTLTSSTGALSRSNVASTSPALLRCASNSRRGSALMAPNLSTNSSNAISPCSSAFPFRNISPPRQSDQILGVWTSRPSSTRWTFWMSGFSPNATYS